MKILNELNQDKVYIFLGCLKDFSDLRRKEKSGRLYGHNNY